MREKLFETMVKRYLETQGAWFVKFFANRNTKAGVPDILACINGCFLAIEVKSDSGSPSELQLRCISKIRLAGGCAFVLYPSGFEKFKLIVRDLKHGYIQEMPVIIK